MIYSIGMYCKIMTDILCNNGSYWSYLDWFNTAYILIIVSPRGGP